MTDIYGYDIEPMEVYFESPLGVLSLEGLLHLQLHGDLEEIIKAVGREVDRDELFDMESDEFAEMIGAVRDWYIEDRWDEWAEDSAVERYYGVTA